MGRTIHHKGGPNVAIKFSLGGTTYCAVDGLGGPSTAWQFPVPCLLSYRMWVTAYMWQSTELKLDCFGRDHPYHANCTSPQPTSNIPISSLHASMSLWSRLLTMTVADHIDLTSKKLMWTNPRVICDQIWENPPYGINAQFAQRAFLVH